MSGGGKGGSDSGSTTIKLPKSIEEAANANLDIANEVASIGYVPYDGPQVAGFTPMQLASMSGVDAAANAFGLPSLGGGTLDTSIPSQLARLIGSLPNQSAMGINSYSPRPIYDTAQARIPQAQRRMIDSFVTNPVTGAKPKNPVVPEPKMDVYDAQRQREADERERLERERRERARRERARRERARRQQTTRSRRDSRVGENSGRD